MNKTLKFCTNNRAYLSRITGWHPQFLFERDFLKPTETTFKTEVVEDLPVTEQYGHFSIPADEALYEYKDPAGLQSFFYRGNPAYRNQGWEQISLQEAKRIATRMFGPQRPWEGPNGI